MAHGTITNNHTTGTGNGGGIYIENGDFTINAGEISGNTVSNGNGGGVYIVGSDGNGNFTMDGPGAITGNSASGNGENVGFGGGIYVHGGNFTLTENASAGSISKSVTEYLWLVKELEKIGVEVLRADSNICGTKLFPEYLLKLNEMMIFYINL